MLQDSIPQKIEAQRQVKYQSRCSTIYFRYGLCYQVQYIQKPGIRMLSFQLLHTTTSSFIQAL